MDRAKHKPKGLKKSASRGGRPAPGRRGNPPYQLSVYQKSKINPYPSRFDFILVSRRGAPDEVRTRVLALRGPRPRPLDNGGGIGLHFSIPLHAGQTLFNLKPGLGIGGPYIKEKAMAAQGKMDPGLCGENSCERLDRKKGSRLFSRLFLHSAWFLRVATSNARRPYFEYYSGFSRNFSPPTGTLSVCKTLPGKCVSLTFPEAYGYNPLSSFRGFCGRIIIL
jgi:hypothetical protein